MINSVLIPYSLFTLCKKKNRFFITLSIFDGANKYAPELRQIPTPKGTIR